MTKGLNPLAIFNLVDTVLKVGIEKAKKDVEEEGVEIIEKFLVEKESVILRLSDFAEQVFNRIHPKSVASVPFLNKGATPPWHPDPDLLVVCASYWSRTPLEKFWGIF